METLEQANKEYYITTIYLLNLASRAGDLFERSNVEEKRDLLKFILWNCTLDGETLHYDLKKPLSTIFDLADRSRWLGSMDSNHDTCLQRAMSYH